MIAAGIDIGSTACKAAVLVDGELAGWAIGPASTDPAGTAEAIFGQALEQAGKERSAVDRLVGMFPTEERDPIRMQLSVSLRAILALKKIRVHRPTLWLLIMAKTRSR